MSEVIQSIRQHRGIAVWFTGLSGAGKTTISEAVASKLSADGYRVQLLDAASARENLGRELGFSKQDRAENVRRIGFVAGLLVSHGVITLVAAMSPEREVRESVLRQLSASLEVFVDAPLAVCEQRDPVGLYRRFHQGEVQHLSGLDDPYEAPLNPGVHCRTAQSSLDECAEQVVNAILRKLGANVSASAAPTRAEQ